MSCVDNKSRCGIEQLIQMDPPSILQAASHALDPSKFLDTLKQNRGNGRNDYPIEQLWTFLLTAVAHRLPSLSHLSHLSKNPIPSPSAFSRFISTSIHFYDILDEMLFSLAEVGKVIALGSIMDKHERMTFLFDTETGLPFLWESGPLTESPLIQATKILNKNPFRSSRCLIASSEYESLAQVLWKEYELKPIIPVQSKSNERRLFRTLEYEQNGQLHCPGAPMVYVGFEKERNSLKFRCAAIHYGYECKDFEKCKWKSGVRVPIETEPAVFSPLPRFSYRWERLYSRYQLATTIEKILFSSTPSKGRKSFYFRLASLIFSAAYRTEKWAN